MYIIEILNNDKVCKKYIINNNIDRFLEKKINDLKNKNIKFKVSIK